MQKLLDGYFNTVRYVIKVINDLTIGYGTIFGYVKQRNQKVLSTQYYAELKTIGDIVQSLSNYDFGVGKINDEIRSVSLV